MHCSLTCLQVVKKTTTKQTNQQSVATKIQGKERNKEQKCHLEKRNGHSLIVLDLHSLTQY